MLLTTWTIRTQAAKKRLLDICTEAFQIEQVKSAGELELAASSGRTLRCELVAKNQEKV